VQIVVSFLPWILYAALDGTTGWSAALAAALVTSIAVAGCNYRTTRRLDVMQAGSVAFFALLLIASTTGPGEALHGLTTTLGQGWIAAVMWLSLPLGRPFTEAAARAQAPADVWDTPVFRRMNVSITALWAASFTLTTAGLALVPGLTASVGFQVLAVVVPLVAMKPFIRAAERAGEAAEAQEAAERADQGARVLAASPTQA
jgi:hypothetical protein